MVFYEACRLEIRDGDLLAFRNGGLLGLVGRWTHIAMALWVKQTLCLAECREWYGGRMVTLSSQVTRYPGRIDVFRPQCSHRLASYAAEVMARQAGHDYGWANIKWAALRHIFSHPVSRDTTPSKWQEPKICSQAACWSYRHASKLRQELFDPCEGVNDKCVEPTPLVESVDSGGRRHFKLFAEGLVHRSAA